MPDHPLVIGSLLSVRTVIAMELFIATKIELGKDYYTLPAVEFR